MENVSAEKEAKILVDIFKRTADGGWFVDENFAINCAIACVKRIILSEPTMPLNYYEDSDNETQAQSQLNYWNEVNEELIKLLTPTPLTYETRRIYKGV